jgi:hypothetical protein
VQNRVETSLSRALMKIDNLIRQSLAMALIGTKCRGKACLAPTRDTWIILLKSMNTGCDLALTPDDDDQAVIQETDG